MSTSTSAPQAHTTASAPPTAIHAPASGRKARGSKPPQETPQLQYAKEIARTSRYFRDEGGSIYEWRGSHFAVVELEAAERHAFDYLEHNFPDRATPQLAASCSGTVRIKAPLLPRRDPRKLMIPLRNAYLEVKDDGKIVRHSPEKRFGMTYVLNASLPQGPTSYVPCTPPSTSLVGRFLATSIPDEELRAFVQELAGDTLTPDTKLQRGMLLKGGGANGKSVFMKLLAALHSRTASMRLNELSSFQLMPLIGASLVVVDEVPKAGINEQMLKTLISGEPITVDRKHRDPITYTPTAKWVISTNNDQKMQDNSYGLWRRLVTIPFDQRLATGSVILGLDKQIIEKELHLFLDWCLIGLQRLLQRGQLPSEPLAIQEAKRQAIEASNSIAAWRADLSVTASGPCTHEKQGVYDDYRLWCQSQGLRAFSANVFWKGLKEVLGGLEEEQRRVGGGRQRFVNLVFASEVDAHENPFTSN